MTRFTLQLVAAAREVLMPRTGEQREEGTLEGNKMDPTESVRER